MGRGCSSGGRACLGSIPSSRKNEKGRWKQWWSECRPTQLCDDGNVPGICAPSSMAPTGHMWLLRTWHMTQASRDLTFWYNVVTYGWCAPLLGQADSDTIYLLCQLASPKGNANLENFRIALIMWRVHLEMSSAKTQMCGSVSHKHPNQLFIFRDMQINHIKAKKIFK